MKSCVIIFSFLLATTCAASLGQHDANKVTASSETISEASEKQVNTIESVDEDCKEASKIGTKALEALTKVVISDEIKQADAVRTKNIVEDVTKSQVVSDTVTDQHAEKHVHTREIERPEELLGAGTQTFQSNGFLNVGGSGIASRSGSLTSTSNYEGADSLVNNRRLLQSENLIYNQGASGLLSSGGLSGSSQVLNSGRIGQTSNQFYNAGGSAIQSGQINSGSLIQTNQLAGTGLRGGNNEILINNYQSAGSNIAAGNRQIVLGLDELNSVPQTVEYSKQFYSFEAPEEPQESGQVTKQLSNVLKKNLQVIFINAPENAATTNAALQLAKQAIEQRTAIYVLSREAESAQLVGQLEQIQDAIQTKPEVKIIKYRTADDLERAKQEIQAQYEATGGSTEAFNGGIVPVLNYASPAEARNGIATLLGQGIISSSHLDGGHHTAESSNVVSAVKSEQNSQTSKDAFLGSSVGQLNIIKGSATGSGSLNSGSGFQKTATSGSVVGSSGSFSSGLIGSNSQQAGASGSLLGSSGQAIGSSKYFQSGPVVGATNSQIVSNSGSSTGYTRELGSNSIVAPITKFPVNSDVALKTSTGNSASGSSGLIDSYSVDKTDGFGSSALQASRTGSSSGSLYTGSSSTGSSSLLSGNIGSEGSSPIGSSSLSGTQTRSNLDYNSGKVSLGINSEGPTSFTSKTTITSTSTTSSGSAPSSSILNSSGSKSSGSISSFGSGSSSNIGSASSLGSSSGSSGSTSSKTGSYASHVTVESSKLTGSGSSSATGHGSSSVNDGVSALSSTQIDHGLKGSASNKVGVVETNNYYSSTTEKTSSFSTATPTPNNRYLPPSIKKN